mmetsp:Transcript_12626/g.32015  ORF Transcript_12626/g.32015 Transcript_12626/m.32015 type:complete len:378 (-) Transcript_12626:457-1590(-)
MRGAIAWTASRTSASEPLDPMMETDNGTFLSADIPMGIVACGKPAKDASTTARKTLVLHWSTSSLGKSFLIGATGMAGRTSTFPLDSASLSASPTLTLALIAISTSSSVQSVSMARSRRSLHVGPKASRPSFTFLHHGRYVSAISWMTRNRPASATASRASSTEVAPRMPSALAAMSFCFQGRSSGPHCLLRKFPTLTWATWADPSIFLAATDATILVVAPSSSFGSQNAKRSSAIRTFLTLCGGSSSKYLGLLLSRPLPTARKRAGSRANQPTVSKVGARGTTPRVDTAEIVGRMPNTPQHAAGMRVLPHVSVPIAKSHKPLPTATADPLDDPPGIREDETGLTGVPSRSFSPSMLIASWSNFAFPTPLAPKSSNF